MKFIVPTEKKLHCESIQSLSVILERDCKGYLFTRKDGKRGERWRQLPSGFHGDLCGFIFGVLSSDNAKSHLPTWIVLIASRHNRHLYSYKIMSCFI